jgi:hypothetical protein
MLVRTIITLGFLAIASAANAQAYRYDRGYSDSDYQPRVYQAPAHPLPGSRDTYVNAGSAAGGVAGWAGSTAASRGRCGGGCSVGAQAAGSFAGAEAGGRLYDDRASGRDYYSSPRAYGVQTTSPYMVQRRRR